MYAAERQQRIMAEARQAGRVEVTALADSLGVAAETVRRDLTALERRGSLRRVHGGAIPVERLELEPTLAARSGRLADVKRRIAARALDELPERRQRASSTPAPPTQAVAELLPPDLDLTVLTNSSRPPRPCRPHPGITLYLLGGRVRGTTGAAVGDWATSALDGVVVDVAVMGTNGFSVARGLTTPDQAEALVKAAMVALRPPRRAGLTDSSKSGDDHLHRFAAPRRRRPRHHRHRPRRRRGRRAARGRPRSRDRMIVTLTPNPSIDRAIVIDALRRGEVHRATCSRVDPGGKGVNVSRALAAQGGAHRRRAARGGPEGHLLEELLDAAGVARRSVPVAGALRMNVSVLEPDGTTTKLNEPGPGSARPRSRPCSPPPSSAAGGADWVVGCGSLPPGAPTDAVRRAGHPGARARRPGRRRLLRRPMTAAVAARPNLIKPNHEELAELVGHPLPTLGDVRAAARDLVADGIEVVAVSLGGDGALLVTADELVHATATITAPLSHRGRRRLHARRPAPRPVDRPRPAADALAGGRRLGRRRVTLPGSRVPAPHDLDGIARRGRPAIPGPHRIRR